MICTSGLVGIRGLGMKAASLGCVHKASSQRVYLSKTKICLSGSKCKCPKIEAVCPSRKSYATKGTFEPLKYCHSEIGNCLNMKLIASTKDNLIYPNGKWREEVWQPTFAQRVTGGKRAID